LICALLFVVWMTNLYNFMDGMDGFAGGMAFFGFGTFAVLGDMAGQSFFAALNFIVAAAAAGFLVFNFPPARIFMGDVGSSTLGLLAAAFALWGDSVGAFPLWIGILVFSPFIVDATATLHRRLYEGHRIWVPHKTHYYQRLVRLGWNHRRAVLAEYVLMAMSAASAFYASGASVIMQWVTIVVWGVIYVVVAATVRRYEATASGGGNASGC
jgi:UDP-N-acetylmuramyl pentapeptide phosphotransferase/UDP-N-acetylglucosamine-1-phosphate transferase